jgi:hypothetical protein
MLTLKYSGEDQKRQIITLDQSRRPTANVLKKSKHPGYSSTVKAAANGVLNAVHTNKHKITLKGRPLAVKRQKVLLKFAFKFKIFNILIFFS